LADSVAAVRDPAWIADRRQRAAALDLPVPSFKGQTGWEFTPLGTSFALSSFPPAVGGPLTSVEPAHVLAVPDGAIELLQVDSATSDGAAVEDGPIVLPLDEAASAHPELVEPYLGSVVPFDTDAFTASNEASWRGGAFVWVPRGVKVDVPILLTTVNAVDGAALHRRTLIVLEDGADAEI
jgi:hypothetical protein